MTEKTEKDGDQPPEGTALYVDKDISEQVYRLYDGRKMTKRDTVDARTLAALWQIAKMLRVVQAQSIENTRCIMQVMEPPCEECGK